MKAYDTFTEDAVNGLARTAVKNFTATALNVMIPERLEVTKHRWTYHY